MAGGRGVLSSVCECVTCLNARHAHHRGAADKSERSPSRHRYMIVLVIRAAVIAKKGTARPRGADTTVLRELHHVMGAAGTRMQPADTTNPPNLPLAMVRVAGVHSKCRYDRDDESGERKHHHSRRSCFSVLDEEMGAWQAKDDATEQAELAVQQEREKGDLRLNLALLRERR